MLKVHTFSPVAFAGTIKLNLLTIWHMAWLLSAVNLAEDDERCSPAVTELGTVYILDPTIRFEIHADQPHEVDSEKKRIYDPTIPFYKDKYSLSHIDVIGLMVGARGKEENDDTFDEKKKKKKMMMIMMMIELSEDDGGDHRTPI
ncbi:hypothetical protein ANN_21780 [Periplaneta americana]|uniref:Uncharacterized protein n=1 Tax=Periplaneta americana TaxID=6978 RepID=A0ABQ8S6N2_PERAM|nr:hypothetical protein ANN_21780 [Periplaneta americana]